MDNEILGLLRELKSAELTLKPNLYKIPPNYLGITEESANKFNKIYDWCLREEEAGNLHRTVKTPSGGISVDRRKGFKLPAFNVENSRNGIQLILLLDCGMWKIYFKVNPAKREDAQTKTIYPNQAFARFKKECANNNINLDDYKIDNGAQVKETIEKPLIKVENPFVCRGKDDPGMAHCHHIDFHSSYLGGLKLTHPEFAPVVDFFYNHRKDNPEYKAVLNYTQGMMQSLTGGRKAEWAHLVRDMIKNNNDRVRAVAQELKQSGRVVLLYNTDGIWYQGDIYHGDGEGTVAGTWGNDHIECLLRIRSAGAYEFVENGEYHPVLRGSTTLDKIKNRTDWEWGDIYNGCALQFYFDPAKGIIKYGGNEE